MKNELARHSSKLLTEIDGQLVDCKAKKARVKEYIQLWRGTLHKSRISDVVYGLHNDFSSKPDNFLQVYEPKEMKVDQSALEFEVCGELSKFSSSDHYQTHLFSCMPGMILVFLTSYGLPWSKSVSVLNGSPHAWDRKPTR